MNLPTVAVIMAGGSGERFWPLSRRDRPKQILHLTNDNKSMLEESIDRLIPLIPADRVYVATSQRLVDPIRTSLDSISASNILGEPLRRNTTGCLAYATAFLLARYHDQPDLLVAAVAADHLVEDKLRFQQTMEAALKFAEDVDALVAIGVHPTRPETGYGYIEITELNKPLSDYQGIPIYRVVQFLEKPTLENAERYQASRFYYWNSGMFFWRISTFLNSLGKVHPELVERIYIMRDLFSRDPAPMPEIEAVFREVPDISIDYALMETATNVYVALGDFRWDDVGSWDSLSRFRPHDDRRNTPIGAPVLIDCQNVTVYNHPGGDAMSVCVIGMEDTVVVATHDGVLVCPKDRCQDVKLAVQELKRRQASQL